MSNPSENAPPERRVYANRTLNLRSIEAVGCDMDYTLIHYDVNRWEGLAYAHAKARLSERGFPVEGLEFDPELVARGLVVDLERGNVLKANRFGYVVLAAHGTSMLEHGVQRDTYRRVQVDLSDPRWEFLNTSFSLSEACLFSQLVDRLDAQNGALPPNYADLYRAVRVAMDASHLEGELKAEIVKAPERYVALDPELPLALLDLEHAGKTLLLVTNSEWSYTSAMMTYAFDRFLPTGRTWRDLFSIIVVGARKPRFFTEPGPAFEIVDESGLLRPHLGPLERGHAYQGCNAQLVEESLGVHGDQILYLGDHVFADVHVSKDIQRWRTALVVRELEQELAEAHAFAPDERELSRLMAEKTTLEQAQATHRLTLQRAEGGYGPATDAATARGALGQLKERIAELDRSIAPLAERASQLGHSRWGALMRAGNDKSRMARQIERYADVYTSRVSNLLFVTPFAYLRAPRTSMPHDVD